MKWTIVRGFGKVKYFNISYVVLLVVPILAELHAKAAAASEFFKNSIAFPPTLRWLYAASLFYAIGITIYQYFCPAIIKRFEDSDAYLHNFHDIFLRAHPHHRLNIVLAHLEPDLEAESRTKIETLLERRDTSDEQQQLEVQKELNTLVDSLHADAVQRFLVKEYDCKNVKAWVALWISFALYMRGHCTRQKIPTY
jgi:hypothetical protein